MSKLQLTQALTDILPTYSGEFPNALLSYVESIYQLSLQKVPILPHRADVARYHICTYLAVERFQERFALPKPVAQRIPVQPKYMDKVLDEVRVKVISKISSPTSTPRKKSNVLSSPSKRSYDPSVSSPLKKLQKLSSQVDMSNEFTMQSPFNPGPSNHTHSNGKSPFIVEDSPSSSNERSSFPVSKSPFVTPKSSPSKTPLTATPSSPRYGRQLSIAEFISFANNFYVPAEVTPQILETFLSERHKFIKKNEWLLACGLIHAAYIRINHAILQNTVGKKGELQEQLFHYQKGGLMKSNMMMWVNIIEESVKSLPWAVDLELKFIHNDWSKEDTTKEQEIQAKLGKGWELSQTFGSMMNPSVMFDKQSQIDYYHTWTERVVNRVNEISASISTSISASNRESTHD